MSQVTAVPIRPLARGTLLKLWLAIILLCLAGAALAWVGTRAQQVQTLTSGAQLRTLGAGNGPKITTADAFALRYKLHVGSVDAPVIQDSDETGGPFVATTSDVYPGFADALQQMQAGGRYLLWLPPGTHQTGPIPAGAPFQATDTLVFEIQVLQIGAGQASALQMQRMQQMMMQQQQQGGAGGSGGAGAPPPPAGDSPARPGGR